MLSQAQKHNEFESFDSDGLTADRNRLAAEFDRITFEASACMRDATHCHLASFQPPSKPLPKKLPTVPSSLVVPNFVGLHPSEADALSTSSGVPNVEGQPNGPDDTFVAESLRNLQEGLIDQDTHIVDLHPHSDNQIVVSDQRPAEGSFLKPGSSVELGYGLMAGVPR